MARRGFAPRRGRGFRPATFWSAFASTGYSNLAGASKVIVGSLVNAADEDLTVRRIRGVISIKSDQIIASEAQLGAFGATVLSSVAVATGATAVPDPVTEAADDMWMLFVPFVQQFLFGTGVGFDMIGAISYDLDSKAMRKMPSGKELTFVLANAGADGLQWAVNVRALFSLSGT